MVIQNFIIHFGSSAGINNWWSYGSSTAVYIVLQILTGLILSIYVVMLVDNSFDVIELLMENNVAMHHVRFLHANICSVVFMLILIHASNGFWISSYQKSNLWKSSSLLLILTIGAAFLSYVLPWGNISLWSATVITNLLSVLPYGDQILLNVWAGYTICSATLGRMFSLHFLVPLLVIGVMLTHLILLHEYVSSSGVMNNIWIVEFNILLNKDIMMWIVWIVVLSMMITIPQFFIDADNWSEANFLVTPDHINPEWYFLFAYAILRCIPNKAISVVSLGGSLIVVLLMGILNIVNMTMIFLGSFVLLTWLGGLEVTEYYTSGSQYASLLYFMFVL